MTNESSTKALKRMGNNWRSNQKTTSMKNKRSSNIPFRPQKE
nr:hypothetical protein [Mycoplasmopsis bovis]